MFCFFSTAQYFQMAAHLFLDAIASSRNPSDMSILDLIAAAAPGGLDPNFHDQVPNHNY
jgi:hypothetical protein